ncbi:uncharacterized protein MONOS_17637 [Monocercomonoides exilis]|uniref:uncharacterized protein n=1 Tax=Monocercomonoides exilis TaxID=2049356 RepID=UPI0035595413|nr:hypothetical protein MONOS_17637 [Monocercomonoides exilis]
MMRVCIADGQTFDVLGELDMPLTISCFEHKAEEKEFVCGIFISQDELIRLANEHAFMKQRLLCCGVTTTVVMENR